MKDFLDENKINNSFCLLVTVVWHKLRTYIVDVVYLFMFVLYYSRHMRICRQCHVWTAEFYWILQSHVLYVLSEEFMSCYVRTL